LFSRYKAELPGKKQLDCVPSARRLRDQAQCEFHKHVCWGFDIKEAVEQPGEPEVA